jgi:hypothetical protein
MRVLLLEGETGVAEEAAGQLTASGHEVARCHDAGSPAFPCNGLADGHECPLDNGPVDVAVVVRAERHPEPTAGEDGARCALRRHIPLVMVGEAHASPYEEWTSVYAAGPEAVVSAVERAGSAPLARHDEVATRALRDVLDIHELSHVGASAEVRRVDGDLRAVLRPSEPISHKVAEVASVRAAGALRAFDPYPERIDVSVDS